MPDPITRHEWDEAQRLLRDTHELAKEHKVVDATIDAKVDLITTKVSNVEAKVSNVEAKVSNVEAKVSVNTVKVANIEGTLAQITVGRRFVLGFLSAIAVIVTIFATIFGLRKH